MWKFAISIGAAGLLLCTALVDSGNGKGGGGGGGGHRGGGGGGAHFSMGHGGGGHAAIHFGGARGGGMGRHAAAVRAFHGRAAHSVSARGSHGPMARGAAVGAAARGLNGAVRPFARAGFPSGHIGWAGALFWPYAYGDLFYYTLWPYQYAYDPLWAYGYDDIYASVFPPYGYERLGRGSRARIGAQTQTCAEEAGEVIGWPIAQIEEVVQPNERQRAALEDLKNAIIKASEVIRSECPTTIAFTPVGRLDTMEARIDALLRAVNIVRPPLERFYDSLSDEQKARFNAIGAPQPSQRLRGERRRIGRDEASGQPKPTAQIERTVRPTPAQREKLDELEAAAANVADTIRASCPSEAPATPPGRLDAVAKWLDAMLQAAKSMRAAVNDFYTSLDDEQKARFNALGRQRSSRG